MGILLDGLEELVENLRRYVERNPLRENEDKRKTEDLKHLQKRHLKSEFAPLQTLSRLFHLVYFVKC